jgi:Zn-dependent protease with chaperone function
MKKILALLATFGLAAVMLAPAGAAQAQNTNTLQDRLWGSATIRSQAANNIGLGTRDVRVTISRIINVALGLLGIVAVVIVLSGGFKWMVAGGDEGKVDEAKKLITAGVIGLAIILSAYAIAQFVITSLIEATAG